METNTTPVVNESREASVTTPEVKNDPFSILETEPVFKSEQNNTEVTQTTEEKNEVKQTEEAAKATEAAQLIEKAKALNLPETATVEEIKAEETKIADALKTKAVELGLPETSTKEEIEAAEKAKADASEGFVTQGELSTGLVGAEDGTWKAFMLAQGHTISEDFNEDNGFEFYTKAEEAKWTEKIESAKVEAKESVLSTLRPELRAAVELANAIPEMTIEEILSPTLQIDNLLKLDKESLLREAIKADHPQMTSEMVDIKMQEYRDANQIDTRYDMIKLELEGNKKNIQEFHNNKIKEYQVKQQQSKLEAQSRFNEQTSKALDGVQTFLDKKLTETDRQFLRNKINSGAIDELKNDPIRLAKALTMLEFYDKGIAGYENRVREKVLLDHKKNLHNTPNTATTTAQPIVAKQPMKSGFDILD